MRPWQHTATFLAFALVAGIIVFAGPYQASFTPGGGVKLAAAEK